MSEEIHKLSEAFKVHAARMEQIVGQLTLTVEMHSKELWGTNDDNPGIKSKVKDLVEARKVDREERLWWRGAIGVPLIGLLVDWVYKFFSKH